MIRSKIYHLKEISEDGLLKDAKNKWGERLSYGEDTEEKCWELIEKSASDRWRGSTYKYPVSHIVICEWRVDQDD